MERKNMLTLLDFAKEHINWRVYCFDYFQSYKSPFYFFDG